MATPPPPFGGILKPGSSPGPSRIFTPSPPGIRTNPGSPQIPLRSASPSHLIHNHHHHQHIPKTLGQIIVESGPKSILREYLPSLISTHFGSIVELTGKDIAQALGIMAATQSQLALSQRANKLQITAPGGSPVTAATQEGWNWGEFVDTLNELASYHHLQPIDWIMVIALLDYPEFYLSDTKGVELIVKAFYRAIRHQGTPTDFPTRLFMGRIWENAPGQLSFLRHALQCSPELGIWSELNLSPVKGRRLLSQEEIDMSSVSTRNALLHLYHQPWNALELLEITVHLLDTPTCYEDARALLELAAKQAPELLCLGLATLRVGWTTPVGDLLAKLTGGFMVGQPGASIVLPRLWRIAPSVIMAVMGEMHRRDPSCISRLLDIAQELKALGIILAEARSPTFVIDLAALASRREHLNLDKWLQETIRDRREPFLRAIVEYLMEHLTVQHHSSTSQPQQERRAPIPPSTEALQLMMKTMAASVPLMAPECAERWTLLLKKLNETPLAATSQPPSCGKFPPIIRTYFDTAAFDTDVEAEANACYERIYAQEASVQDVLTTMMRLRASSNSRDTLIFQCMVHNLLDEFRFFSKYPEKELALTGVIFGQLLQTPGLLEGPPLFIALRMITESLLCHSPESKLWRFGMTALAQCAHETVAQQFPMLCKMLLRGIPNLTAFPAVMERLRQGLLEEEKGLDAQLAPYLEGLDAIHQLKQTNFSSMFISLDERASQALKGELDRLPSEVKPWITGESMSNIPEVTERILFHLNNVVISNVNEKAKEIANIITESASPLITIAWLAFHIITERVMETNSQTTLLLFVRLVDALSVPPNHFLSNSNIDHSFGNTLNFSSNDGNKKHGLLRLTLLTAVCQARSLIATGVEEGELPLGQFARLRSLGMWIGMLTLGRQCPLLHAHIPIRELILEAHDMERLPLVLPFACRVIEGVARAPLPRVLLPANPWLMSVLGLFVDLYHNAHPPLRLNLKFEIEMLLKTLDIQFSEIPVTKILAAPRRSLDIWRGTEVGLTTAAPQQHYYNTTSTSRAMDAAVLAAAAALSLSSTITRPFLCAVGEALSILPRSISDVVVPGSPGVIGMLLLAWEATLRTIVTAEEMERFRTIAMVTALQIITPHGLGDDKYRERVARSLAAHLAGAMLREPLAIAMGRHVENFVQYLGPTEQLESTLMAEVIERIAVVGAALAAHLAAATREFQVSAEHNGVPLSSSSTTINTNSGMERKDSSSTAPSSLHTTNFYSKEVIDVWEAFSGWNGSSLSPSVGGEQSLPPLLLADCIRIGAMLGMKPEGVYPSSLKPVEERTASRRNSQLLDEFDALVMQIRAVASFVSTPTMSPAGTQTNLRSLMKQVLVLALHAPQRDETCAIFAERLWNTHLMASTHNDETTDRAAPTLVLLLDKLCELSSALSRQVAGWIMAIPAQPIWPSVTVVAALLEAGLVSLPAFDIALASSIMNFKSSIAYGTGSISPPFTSTLENTDARLRWAVALAAALAQPLGSLSLFNWEATLTVMGPCTERISLYPVLNQVIEKEQCSIVEGMLDEWMRLIDAVSSSDKTLASFVHQGIARGWFREASLFALFFRVALRWVVTSPATSPNAVLSTSSSTIPTASKSTSGIGIAPATEARNSFEGRYTALARWVVFMVRLWPSSSTISSQGIFPGESLLKMNRCELLSRILAFIVRNIAEISVFSFTELLGGLLVEWHAAERVMMDKDLSALFYRLFTQMMIIFCPTKYPRLALGWLEIFSHRFFLPTFMISPENSSMVLTLILDVLAFWAGAVSSSVSILPGISSQASSSLNVSEAISLSTYVTGGLLRIFLMLLHDFPEFLAAHHWRLVIAMPGAAIQLRNLVLSAFPRQLKLLDPFTPSLKIEALPECYQLSSMLKSSIADVAAELPLETAQLIDSLVLGKEPLDKEVERTIRLLEPPNETISQPAWIARIVFFIIGRSIENECFSHSSRHASLEGSRGAAILTHLLMRQCEDEIRYLIIGGVVNELRFPSPLTLFASLLIRLWFSGDSFSLLSTTTVFGPNFLMDTKEIVVRVLLERLVVQRPHPWGLLITFVEIVRSPQYRFWQQPFAHTSPDIERLFESVARSCMQEGQALSASS